MLEKVIFVRREETKWRQDNGNKKREYYEFLEEYQKIVSQKEFNSDFCNDEEFLDIQFALTIKLKMLLPNEKLGYRPYMTISKRIKIEKLLEKITSGKTISKEDYSGTFSYGIDTNFIFYSIWLILLWICMSIQYWNVV